MKLCEDCEKVEKLYEIKWKSRVSGDDDSQVVEKKSKTCMNV